MLPRPAQTILRPCRRAMEPFGVRAPGRSGGGSSSFAPVTAPRRPGRPLPGRPRDRLRRTRARPSRPRARRADYGTAQPRPGAPERRAAGDRERLTARRDRRARGADRDASGGQADGCRASDPARRSRGGTRATCRRPALRSRRDRPRPAPGVLDSGRGGLHVRVAARRERPRAAARCTGLVGNSFGVARAPRGPATDRRGGLRVEPAGHRRRPISPATRPPERQRRLT
jgi:hypothetical protein